MKIGIVTQPLEANYGGFLQAWALQEKLRKMGHEPMTIDYLRGATPPWYILVRSWIKTLLLLCIGKKRPFLQRQPAQERVEMFDNFVRKNMLLTERVRSYKSGLVKKFRFEAVIVGSDQVWRPRYNEHLLDMFLRFVKKTNVKKIVYAASFGVDTWEYTSKQTRKCSRLAKKLNVISVRENSGISLCKKYFGVDAIEVLDPTLLHTKEDYKKLCVDVPSASEPFLACYLLDLTPEMHTYVEKIANQQGLPIRIFSADENAMYSIEQWLAIYRDATYVITDSFHGTVFSILFHKPFLSIVNENRGASRFHSLAAKFNLDERILDSLDNKTLSKEINWNFVDEKLRYLGKESTDFIQMALSK